MSGQFPSESLHCPGCDNPIEPGERRMPSPNGPVHELCELRESIRDSFNFYINNPAESEGVGFSLWVESGDGSEFPVLSNTGGLTTFGSATTDVGDAIEPSETFVDAVAYTHHMLMCFMRGPDPERIQEELNMWYDGNIPSHEEWAAHYVLSHLHPPGEIIPEFGELRAYVDGCTEWRTPEVMETA